MKFLRGLAVLALIGSLVGNFVLWKKMDKNRSQVKVNDKNITKKDFHDWLEAHGGVPAMASMVRYELITQAAKKASVPADQKEVEEALEDTRERQPAYAQKFKYQSWTEGEYRQQVEMTLALANLTIKDVKATDDEIREYFTANAGKWDKPDKIYMKAVRCADEPTAQQAKQLMEKGITDLKVIKDQLAPKAEIVGADGTWVIAKPFGALGTDQLSREVTAMKPNDVKTFSFGREGIVVMKRTDKTVEGKKVALEEVKAKVVRAFKLTRRKPEQEILRGLWDSATIQTDDPTLKTQIEVALFPERLEQRKTASNQ